jgi:integrase
VTHPGDQPQYPRSFRRAHGNKGIATLQQHHIEAMIGEKAGKPSAQRNLLKVLRSLLDVAVKNKMRRDNPARDIKLDPIRTSGYHSWSEAELRQYEQHHPIGSKPRLALALLLYTAQRRSDVVTLGPASIRAGRLIFTQFKTGTAMDIPIAQPLADIIAATPMIGVKTFLVTDYGKPFTPAGFGNWFRERCNAAGLPHCSAHGYGRPFCAVWPRLDAAKTTSPASVPPRLSRDQDLCAGRQQGTYGDGRNGVGVGDVPRR